MASRPTVQASGRRKRAASTNRQLDLPLADYLSVLEVATDSESEPEPPGKKGQLVRGPNPRRRYSSASIASTSTDPNIPPSAPKEDQRQSATNGSADTRELALDPDSGIELHIAIDQGTKFSIICCVLTTSEAWKSHYVASLLANTVKPSYSNPYITSLAAFVPNEMEFSIPRSSFSAAMLRLICLTQTPALRSFATSS